MSDDKIERLTTTVRIAEIASRPPITRNGLRCRKCNEVIESRYTEDFRFCGCGAVAVDGGLEAPRYLGELEDYEVLAEYGPPDPTKAMAYVLAAEALLGALGTAPVIDEVRLPEAFGWMEEARVRAEKAR